MLNTCCKFQKPVLKLLLFGNKRFGEVFVTKYRFKEKTMQQGYVIPLSEVSRNVLNKMIPVTYIEKPKPIVPIVQESYQHMTLM